VVAIAAINAFNRLNARPGSSTASGLPASLRRPPKQSEQRVGATEPIRCAAVAFVLRDQRINTTSSPRGLDRRRCAAVCEVVVTENHVDEHPALARQRTVAHRPWGEASHSCGSMSS
jgi:hypothetical protein